MEEARVVVKDVRIVRPRRAQLSIRTSHCAIVDVLVVGLAPAAFDVAAPDVKIRADRSRVRLIRCNLRRRTDRRRLLRTQQGIAAVDEILSVARDGTPLRM